MTAAANACLMPNKTKSPKTRSAHIKFLQKPSCTSCRKARALLQENGVELEMRDIGKDRLTAQELDELISDRDYLKFLNTRNELFRQRNMAKNPPARDEALRLMAAEPNLIRRPLTICGNEIILGFDEQALKRVKS